MTSDAIRSSVPLRAAGRLVASLRRRTGLRGWRLGMLLALVVAAVALRGSVGALLAIVASLVLLDCIVPMPGGTRSQADDHFRRLVRDRRHAAMLRRVRRLPPERLDVLDDREGWAATASRRALGVQSIGLDSVTGTVEESHARTFDRRFRPHPSSREHWERLWLAQERGATLPPISVYRVDGAHVVRDGHHRVSVAREHGDATIEAIIVELLPPRR
jgi:hypothetical protein